MQDKDLNNIDNYSDNENITDDVSNQLIDHTPAEDYVNPSSSSDPYEQDILYSTHEPLTGADEEHIYYSSFTEPLLIEPPKVKKKRFNGLKRVALITASAFLFGIVLQTTLIISKPILATALSNVGFATNISIQLSATKPIDTPSLSTDMNAPIVAVAEEVGPSIVAITSTTRQRGFYNNIYETEGSGSGIIIGNTQDEILIATNQHVVANTTKLMITFFDKTNVEGTVRGTDSANDLAVIAINVNDVSPETLGNIRVAILGNSDNLKPGETAIAIGNPLGYSHTITAGVISAVNRDVNINGTTLTLVQTDAAINPGNSGGALLNIKGEVIGINTVKFASTEVEGMGFAVPINIAKPILERLMTESPATATTGSGIAYIGITGQDIDDTISSRYRLPIGIYIVDIADNSPAYVSDLYSGDVVTAINDITVATMSELQQELTKYAPNDKITLNVYRNTGRALEQITVEVTLGEKPTE